MFGSIVQYDGIVGEVIKEVINDDENSLQIANGAYLYAVPKKDVKPFPLKEWPSDTSAYNLEFAIETKDSIKVPGWNDEVIVKIERLEDGELNVYVTTMPIHEGSKVEKYSVPKVKGIDVYNEFDDEVHAPAPEKVEVNQAFVANLPRCTSWSKVLVLDSAAGGTTQRLRSNGYRGKIYVPNPALETLEGAIVEQVSLHEFVLSMSPTIQFAAIALDACCKFYNLKPVVNRLLKGQNLQMDGTLWITFSVRGIANPDDHVAGVKDEVFELAKSLGYDFSCVYLNRYDKIGCIIFKTEIAKRRKI